MEGVRSMVGFGIPMALSRTFPVWLGQRYSKKDFSFGAQARASKAHKMQQKVMAWDVSVIHIPKAWSCINLWLEGNCWMLAA